MLNFLSYIIIKLKCVTASSLVKNRAIPIISYHTPDESGLWNLPFKSLNSLPYPNVVSSPTCLDTIWHAGLYLANSNSKRPNWSGFMQAVYVPAGSYPHPADIHVLPIIDLNPNNVTCIYSTLCFIENQAKLLNMKTACITFDQPLWLKAVETVQSTKLNVVCCLGAFHIIMSFLGSG